MTRLQVCPIKGVSEDCKGCNEIGWGSCVYWKVYEARKKPSKSSPYKPLETDEKEAKPK